jgi:hypothetical protein
MKVLSLKPVINNDNLADIIEYHYIMKNVLLQINMIDSYAKSMIIVLLQ